MFCLCIFVILVVSHFGVDVLIASVPGHCLPYQVNFEKRVRVKCNDTCDESIK